jgi:nucleoside-diphosphate kinase
LSFQPDGVDRGLVGEIMARFEKRGFKLIAAKLTSPSKEHLEKREFLRSVQIL